MDELRVDLAAFRGPLDLLLHLVQQEEVDIMDIPLARVADRFLEVVRSQVQALDVDQAGEFLVMASHLLVIKSRSLLPRDEPIDLEDIDPRLDLVRQLMEYRDFKSISEELERRAEEERLKQPVRVRHERTVPDPGDEELEVDLYGLVAAFQKLLAETGDSESVAMPKERLPITHFVGHIFDQLVTVGGSASFRELVGSSRDRSVVIGTFLALLELIKLRKVRALQDGLEDIRIELTEEAMDPGHEDAEEVAERALEASAIGDDERTGPRVVFMGTPDFAVPTLRRLAGAGYEPVLVVTPPPRQAGRGRRAKPTPVAVAAEDLQVPVHRTHDVNAPTSLREIAAAQPDVIVTAAFGQKLKREILALPHHGCLNVHASLLPKYRGASPIAAAIRDGAPEIGVTIFRMTKGWDTGPVLSRRGVALGTDTTLDEATAQLAEIGADLLVESLGPWLAGELEAVPQDDAEATYVGRVEKDDGVIDWSLPAQRVHDHVRSVTSWPGAQTAWQPKVRHDPLALLVTSTRVLAADEAPPAPDDARAGTVLAAGRDGLDVSCGEGVVRVLRVRPAGGREMAVGDFLNSRRVAVGDRFVAPRAP
ncbi:MAG: methionyl-tRNA formyltransferase [Planctomycetota bacterium]|nr:methionyl-tRNA formyltransferase [Planctomycetota bacterium]MCB9826458.1 methionyl-tRNA formyltransferase [Planctomycetota bacterium]